MRRYHFITATILLSVTLLTQSCSNHDEYQALQPEQNTIVDNSRLLHKLRKINENILSDKQETRGWTTKEIFNVARADIEGALAGGKGGALLGGKIGMALGNPITGATFGAFLGGFLTGSCFSWAASPDRVMNITNSNKVIEYKNLLQVCELTITDNLTINDNVIMLKTPDAENKIIINPNLISKVKLSDTQINVGKMHNIALATLDGSIEIDRTKAIKIKDTLINTILKSNEMEVLYNDLANKYISGIPIEYNPLTEHVMELFNEVFQQYSYDNEDVVFLINKYAEAINESEELTEEQKNDIKTGLATALYSFNYWSITLQQQ